MSPKQHNTSVPYAFYGVFNYMFSHGCPAHRTDLSTPLRHSFAARRCHGLVDGTCRARPAAAIAPARPGATDDRRRGRRTCRTCGGSLWTNRRPNVEPKTGPTFVFMDPVTDPHLSGSKCLDSGEEQHHEKRFLSRCSLDVLRSSAEKA